MSEIRDSCRRCELRGDMAKCAATECYNHDNWYATALRAENERLRALLREVAEGGVEFADERVRYVAVQIDRETWARVRAITAPAEEDGRDE